MKVWKNVSVYQKLVNQGLFESALTNEICNSNLYKIYGLINPETGNLFYLGCTISKMSIRLRGHYSTIGTTHGNYRHEELLKLAEKQIVPEVKVFYSIKDKTEARTAEKYLINFLSTYTNANLYNVNYTKELIK